MGGDCAHFLLSTLPPSDHCARLTQRRCSADQVLNKARASGDFSPVIVLFWAASANVWMVPDEMFGSLCHRFQEPGGLMMLMSVKMREAPLISAPLCFSVPPLL